MHSTRAHRQLTATLRDFRLEPSRDRSVPVQSLGPGKPYASVSSIEKMEGGLVE